MNKVALEKKNLEIQRIEEHHNQEMKEITDTINQKDQLIKQQNEEKDELKSELAKYREREESKRNKKEKRKRVICFILSILWKVAIIVILTCVAVYLEKKLESNIPMYVCVLVDMIALTITGITTFKNGIAKYFPKDDLEK